MQIFEVHHLKVLQYFDHVYAINLKKKKKNKLYLNRNIKYMQDYQYLDRYLDYILILHESVIQINIVAYQAFCKFPFDFCIHLFYLKAVAQYLLQL